MKSRDMLTTMQLRRTDKNLLSRMSPGSQPSAFALCMLPHESGRTIALVKLTILNNDVYHCRYRHIERRRRATIWYVKTNNYLYVYILYTVMNLLLISNADSVTSA